MGFLIKIVLSIAIILIIIPSQASYGGKDDTITKSSIIFLQDKPSDKFVTELPRKTKSIEFKNSEIFRSSNDTYYTLCDNKYKEILPPLGLIVKKIPAGYERVLKNGKIVYFQNGSFYYLNSNGKDFTVRQGPVNVQVSKLPIGAIKAKYNNIDCYVYYNAVYKKTGSQLYELYTLLGYITN